MARRSVPLQLLAVLLIAVLATGCVSQPVDEAQVAQGEDNAVVAAPLAEDEARQLAGADTPKERRRNRRRGEAAQQTVQPNEPAAGAAAAAAAAGGSKVTTTNRGSGNTAPAPAAAAAFVELAALDDRPGDASGDAPAYADVDRVVIDSNGATARVSLVFAGNLPPVLADGEVQGIGVDFYRSGGRESDFQLFADGGYKGWRAFLHGPEGVVPFQGTFRVGGNVMVFEVPWASVGGTDPADVTVFSDWSQERALINAVGNDRAPNSGKMTVRPARS